MLNEIGPTEVYIGPKQEEGQNGDNSWWLTYLSLTCKQICGKLGLQRRVFLSKYLGKLTFFLLLPFVYSSSC